MRLVSAVEAGGLQVAAVDLIPLALTRALARPVPAMAAAPAGGGVALADDAVGAEGIVSFGGGVTAIAVHEGGVPRFVRVLGSGGRELTDAIAHDLEVPVETAEALKRAIADPAHDDAVARARTAMDRPLSVLLDEVRSSIDYYRNQPGSTRLLRVVATGGSAQLPGLPERLAALVGVPVEPAYMRDLIRIGDIGFAPDELPRLEPYLPAAVGLALGGAKVGTVVDLLPRARRTTTTVRQRVNTKVVAPVAVGIVLLGGLTFLAHSKASSEKSKQAALETEAVKLKDQLDHALQGATPGGQTANLRGEAASVLGTDIGWTQMLGDLRTSLPNGVWLTNLQAQHSLVQPSATGPTASPTGASGASGASGATGARATGSSPAAGSALSTGAASTPPGGGACATYQDALTGPVAMSGIAKDLPALASFLDKLAVAGDAKNPIVTGVALATAQKATFGDADVITFTVNATLASGARSDRLHTFFEGALCK
jgi:type IV pilus assembly protein PilM